jgi:hypothetical protein
VLSGETDDFQMAIWATRIRIQQEACEDESSNSHPKSAALGILSERLYTLPKSSNAKRSRLQLNFKIHNSSTARPPCPSSAFPIPAPGILPIRQPLPLNGGPYPFPKPVIRPLKI